MKTFPLSQSQLGVFLEMIQYPQMTQYNMGYLFSLPKSISLERLEQALKTIYAARPELRIRFLMEGDEPRQIVDDTRELSVVRLTMTEEPCEEYLKELIKPFDIFNDILCRFYLIDTPERNLFVSDFSHLIVDGLSFNLFMKRDLPLAYEGKPLPEQSYSMFSWAEDEDAATHTTVYEQDKEYFRQHFYGVEALSLANNVCNPLGKRISCDEYLSMQEVTTWCQQYNTAPNLLLMAAFVFTLSSIGRLNEFAFTTTSHGRMNRKIRQTIGMFVRTMPTKAVVNPDAKVIDFIKSFRAEQMGTIRHSSYPFSHFCRDLRMKPGIGFNFHSGEITEELLLDGVVYLGSLLDLDSTCSDLTLFIFERDGVYDLRPVASERLYSLSFLQTIARTIKTVTQCMMCQPDSTLASLNIVTEAEKTALIRLGAGKSIMLNSSETLVDLFRKQAARTPDNIAIVFEDNHLTYHELDELTDRLAAYLINHYHVQAEEVVGVMIARSELMAVFPLAIMKAGAAYMPLDFDFPESRLRYMCQDAEVRLILSDKDRIQYAMPSFKGEVFTADALQNLPESDCRLPKSHADQRYVVLFTSGSTGIPKGVVLEHHNIVNFCHWYVREFKMTDADRSLAMSNFGFDAHMMDIYPALITGAAVYIVSDEMRMDIDALKDYMEENSISIAFMTTQLGCVLLDTFNENKSLRLLSIGGEKLRRVSKPMYDLYNAYGPTECTIFSTVYKIGNDTDVVPIGRPIDNCQLYVVDKEMRLLPQGMPGELIIGGEGVARGYLHPEEKDRHRFMHFMGQWCYRSGDLVRWNGQGQLEYLRRLDNQVKLRGFRIELGEIENQATGMKGIRQAVATVHDGQMLCLYYTSDCGMKEEEIKKSLSQVLPDYMVPSVYVQLEEMPLNDNGKIDLRHLPKPVAPQMSYEAPATALEKQITGVFCDLLALDRLSVNTNLRTVGLNSILAMRAKVCLMEQLGISVNVADILRLCCVRDIANSIGEGAAEHKPRFTKRPVQNIYPATKTLETYMADYMAGKRTYMISSAIRIKGARLQEMEKALRIVFDANPSMKVRTSYIDEKPVMLRDDAAEIPIDCYKIDFEPSKAQVYAYCDQPLEIVGGFLGNYTLIETPSVGYFVFKCSHGNMDGASMNMMIQEFVMALNGDRLEPERYTIFDYALDEQDYLVSESLHHDEDHYLQITNNLQENVLPFDDEPEDEAGYAETINVLFDRSSVDDYCRQYNIRQSSFFTTLYMQTFGHMGNWRQVMISSLHSNRLFTELAGMMSLAMRNFPLVCKHVVAIDDVGLEEEMLAEIRNVEQQVDDAMNISFYDYYGSNGLGRKSPNIALKTAFVYYVGLMGNSPDQVELISMEAKRVLAMEPLMAYVNLDDEGNYRLSFRYSHRCYHTATIQRMADYMIDLFSKFIK